MTGQTWWVVAVVAIVVAGVIGFFIGRQTGGTKQRIEELESELESQKEEIRGYRKQVETHFDKTATLFVSMAGSYKELFEHLSSGYEKLSAGSARELFKERVTALLLDGPARKNGDDEIVFEHSVDRAKATPPATDPSGASAAVASSEDAEGGKEPLAQSDEPVSEATEAEAAEKSREPGEASPEPEPLKKDAGDEPANEPPPARAGEPAEGEPTEGEVGTAQPEPSEAGAKGDDEGAKTERN